MIDELQKYKDETYAAFQRKLLPTVPPETVIGVRTPQLRAIAKSMVKSGTYAAFLKDLPHSFFEENQLHALILSELRNFAKCIDETETFLPYVNNWATCDQLSPKVFSKNKIELLPYIEKWLSSDLPFTVRFGIGMLMSHFLESDFDLRYPERVASVQSDEYYVNMMIAWYFATALAKQYDAALPYLEEKRLSPWVHSKTIQKALESYRISPEQKDYLNILKIK